MISIFFKSVFLIIFTLCGSILYSQNNMKEKLKNLFLDLDLSANPKVMVSKSSLQFENVVTQGISWSKKAGGTINYVATFNNNPLISTNIKGGQINILQKEEDVNSGNFLINERVWFNNEEDMIGEYNKLIESFKSLGYIFKNSTVENQNFETKYETTEITKNALETLTIGYHSPSKSEINKEYFLSFVYQKINN